MAFPHVNWARPKSAEYPRIWHNFEVKNIDSDTFEQYRIQDLPESRTEDALTFIVENLCKEEPLCHAYEIYNDRHAIELMKLSWKSIIKQKAVLVCFKEGSDEIVGINMNYVVCRYDVCLDDFDFIDQIRFRLTDIYSHWRLFCKSFYCCNRGCNIYTLVPFENSNSKLNDMSVIHHSILKNFNEFKHYGVNKYLTAAGLAVAQQYRGRGIGVQLLKTREIFCNEFGIKLTLNRFSSNYSNACADKAGFKLEKIRRYADIRNEYPHLPHIESDALTLKYMQFPLQNE